MPVVFSSMNPLFLRRAQLAVTCCAIAANALCAGGIFTFPLISPALASHLKLTQPQLTTIVLAGMVGQYPLASIVGNCIDKYGPWACSLVSSVLFFFGFGLFSWEIANTPVDITHPSLTSFRRLTVFFFMAGLGTVFSYVPRSTLFVYERDIKARKQIFLFALRCIEELSEPPWDGLRNEHGVIWSFTPFPLRHCFQILHRPRNRFERD